MAQDPGKAVDGGNGNEKERGAKDHICTELCPSRPPRPPSRILRPLRRILPRISYSSLGAVALLVFLFFLRAPFFCTLPHADGFISGSTTFDWWR